MNNYLFIFGLLCFCSCNQNTIEEMDTPVVSEERRVEFQSMDDFINDYKILSSGDEVYLKKWIESKGAKSLLNAMPYEDQSLIEIPYALQFILNKNMEFQINDSIIKYNNGNLYLTSVDNILLKDQIVVGSITVKNFRKCRSDKG